MACASQKPIHPPHCQVPSSFSKPIIWEPPINGQPHLWINIWVLMIYGSLFILLNNKDMIIMWHEQYHAFLQQYYTLPLSPSLSLLAYYHCIDNRGNRSGYLLFYKGNSVISFVHYPFSLFFPTIPSFLPILCGSGDFFSICWPVLQLPCDIPTGDLQCISKVAKMCFLGVNK